MWSLWFDTSQIKGALLTYMLGLWMIKFPQLIFLNYICFVSHNFATLLKIYSKPRFKNHTKSQFWVNDAPLHWENHEKISGKCCIFPQFSHFFWRKKSENKFPLYFSQCMVYSFYSVKCKPLWHEYSAVNIVISVWYIHQQIYLNHCRHDEFTVSPLNTGFVFINIHSNKIK